MNRHARPWMMLAGMALSPLVACPPVAPPASDAGEPMPEDAGAPGDVDGGTPLADAGPSPADAGPPPPPPDAGPPPPPFDAGPPVPTTVDLSGEIRSRKYADARPAADAEARIVNVDANGDGLVNGTDISALTVSADASGAYALTALPPGSVMVAQVKAAAEPCTLEGVPTCVEPPGYAARAVVRTYTNPAEVANLYTVPFQWLTEQAVRCGAFASAADAYNSRTLYSTVLGRLVTEQGEPVPNISRNSFQLEVGGYANTELNLCFLERYDAGTPDNDSDDVYRVALTPQATPLPQSTDTGYFLIFKTKNGPAGTGLGEHVVMANAFQEARLSLQAGQVGLMTLRTGLEVTDPNDLIDFETAIMPVFNRNGCVACHYQDGPGAIAPANTPDKYFLLLNGSPDEVYDAIVGPYGLGARLDFDAPAQSKIITMPLLEDPPNHPNASFESVQVADAALLINWIAQGAPRYSLGNNPVLEEPYTLTEVIEHVAFIGCTNCHAADRNANFEAQGVGEPYGNLPLDGCIPFYEYPAEYAPTNSTLSRAEQPPEENQRCIYYHLTQQAAADPAGYGYRVNPGAPDQSLLLRYPYCGFAGCEDLPGHPVQLFFSTDDPAYTYLRSWIGNGAQNDGLAGSAGN